MDYPCRFFSPLPMISKSQEAHGPHRSSKELSDQAEMACLNCH